MEDFVRECECFASNISSEALDMLMCCNWGDSSYSELCATLAAHISNHLEKLGKELDEPEEW